MKSRRRIRGKLPAGPVFALLLVGLLLLSGLFYYRAVNVQRYLEPALALSLPRSILAQRINAALEREFDGSAVNGIRLRSSAIIVEKDLLFASAGGLRREAPVLLRKLARVYLAALDDQTRPDVSMILVITRYPAQDDKTGALRSEQQRQAGRILDALFGSEPALAEKLGRYFASAAMPASRLMQDPDTIEFQIIPSELMHAGVLQSLVKYVE